MLEHFRRSRQVLEVNFLKRIQSFHGLIYQDLLRPLERFCPLEIKDLHIVSRVDLNTKFITIGLVQSLDNTFGVVIGRAPVLDQLDCVVVIVGGAALGSIVHHRHLQIASIEITHRNRRVHGKVIRRNIELLFIGWGVPSHQIPRITVVNFALLHREGVRVGPESTIIAKAIHKTPVYQ